MISLTLITALLSLNPAAAAPLDQATATSDWAFPSVNLDVGQQLPNFALPTTASDGPIHLYDLLDGKKTVLHIFASW